MAVDSNAEFHLLRIVTLAVFLGLYIRASVFFGKEHYIQRYSDVFVELGHPDVSNQLNMGHYACFFVSVLQYL